MSGGSLPLVAEQWGTGAPLLLLHGFTGSAETWRPFATAWPAARLIAVDLPGHGRSPAPTAVAPYRLDETAASVLALADRLGVERFDLLGYSLGARAALRVALRAPARLRALVLESAAPGIAEAAAREARRAADAALAGRIEREGVEAFVDEWERLPLWASQARVSHERLAGLRAQRLRNRAVGLAHSLRGAGQGEEPSLLDALSGLPLPVLLMAGVRDPAYCDHAKAMAARLRRARVEIVADCGHAVHLEAPERFAALVRDFLAGAVAP